MLPTFPLRTLQQARPIPESCTSTVNSPALLSPTTLQDELYGARERLHCPLCRAHQAGTGCGTIVTVEKRLCTRMAIG